MKMARVMSHDGVSHHLKMFEVTESLVQLP